MKQTVPAATTKYTSAYEKRFHQIRVSMEDQKVEALVITHLPNIRYLTNYSGSNATLFILNEEVHFITDDRYKEQIKTELFNIPNLKTHITRDLWKVVVEEGILKKVETLGFEADKMSYAATLQIRNDIRPIKLKPVEAAVVEPFMMAKSQEELDAIQTACEMSDKVFERMLEYIKPGVKEYEIAANIAYHGRMLGSEGDAFDIIALSGPRTAMPHGQPSDRKVQKNDVVLMDFGCMCKGFRSDITRTVFVGKATKEQKQVYDIVLEAEQAGIKAAKPSINAKELDAVGRNIIKAAGYGEYFEHSLGHGLGLEAHESPFISYRTEKLKIPEHCVITIEPGIYLPNKFGIRIEDDIFVVKGGPEVLSHANRELIVL